MLLSFHIFMIVVSLVFAGYVYRHPVKTKIRITYISIAFTTISGILLYLQHPSAALQMFTSGAVYFAAVFFCTSAAQQKLTRTAHL